MKTVLLIAYYVPPRTGIATTRIRQLIEGLSEFGWRVRVVTPTFEPIAATLDPSYTLTPMFDFRKALRKLFGVHNKTAHQQLGLPVNTYGAPSSLRHRLVDFAYLITNYPDAQVGWFPYGVSAVRRLLRTERISAILSSSLPVTCHFIARASQRGIPWLADLRDLWSQNHNLVQGPWRAWSDRALEGFTLSRASALTTVSEPLAELLRERFPGKSVTSIPNAFDEREWDNIPFETEPKCTLMYAGQFYAGRRDPTLLLKAVASLLNNGRIQPTQLAIDIYGDRAEWLTRLINEYGLQTIISLKGTVSRAEILAAERRADGLIVFFYDHPSEAGVYTGKLFEYLGARRPILAIGGPKQSVVDDLLHDTSTGARYTEIAPLAETILSLIVAHERGTPRNLPYSAVERYSSHHMVHAFAEALDRISS